VQIRHLLSYLKETVGLEKIQEAMVKKPKDLRLALYYGCMLLRPREVSIDESSEDPTIMEEVFMACGAEPVYFPFKAECCGAYQTVNEKSVVTSRTREIAGSAVKNTADMLVTSCPLCFYNLDAYQEKVLETSPDFQTIPVMYISQILALMAGLDDVNDYSLHKVDPRPVLREKGLLE
jgi:heterodisulfide reductase subunit B